MAEMLNSVFSSAQYMNTLSKSKLDECHTEIEVSRVDDGLIGKCVVDMQGEERPSLDKSKLSSILRALNPPDWPALKIEKRAVDY